VKSRCRFNHWYKNVSGVDGFRVIPMMNLPATDERIAYLQMDLVGAVAGEKAAIP